MECKTITMYIARDKVDNELWMYKDAPIKEGDIWTPTNSEGVCQILEGEYFKILFEDVKWDDEKPTEIEIKIKRKNGKE